ncbi:hypothetical protein DFH07DRAFT_552205 [Mycena maculata]|uniref:MYND-type domain-containing protein n=1 Tax=Mycena maculata TaxID=230809 RepID=A0AAD7IV46_9AGAR|nr:hypothetical protein DFH07DRAFT_552205 [Mycena maculata]
MHVSLRMSRLNELPLGIQEVATAAANGSFKDLKRLRQMILVEKRHSSEALLPVVHRCLDPKKIPTVDEAAPCNAVSVAALALRTFPAIMIPSGIGSDLWPRIWAWFQFLDTHRVDTHGITPTKVVLLRCAARLRREERSPLMNNTKGFYTEVARVWASPDVQPDALRFVFGHLIIVDMLNLEELMEGVGGNVKDLARLVIQHIHLTTDTNNVLTALRLDLLRDVLLFATRVADAVDDGDGPPNSPRSLIASLVRLGVLKSLMHTVCTLSLTTDPDPAPTLNGCFSFLRALLGPRKMHGVLPGAVADGLIGCILLCAHNPSLITTHHHLTSLLMRNLSASTVYAEVLLEIKAALGREAEILAAVTQELENSTVFGAWRYFLNIVDKRFYILNSILMTSRTTCDNFSCNKKDFKDAFRRCSGCKHFYYCSIECQKADWSTGGHRVACSAFPKLTLGEHHSLTKRDRIFMRALLDEACLSFKTQIYDQTIKCLKTHPAAGYFVVFDYVSEGPFTLEVHSLAEESTVLETLRRSGMEWEYTLARAERSQGSMTIHVMRVREGSAGRYWVIPLRTSTGRVHERLKRIAAELPSPAEGEDLPDYFGSMDEGKIQDRLARAEAELSSLAEEDVPEYGGGYHFMTTWNFDLPA